MPNPLVSAVIITYNQADLIEATVASVASQTYDNWELVIADDGSTDGTVDVLRQLQRRHGDRVRLVLSPANHGITANCNAGLAAARGEYVAWLGGDDEWFPEKLERQVATFARHPGASLCYHAVEHWNVRTGTRTVVGDDDPETRPVEDLVVQCFVNGSSLMHPRSAAPIDGFASNIKHGSDWLFYIELALAGGIVRAPGVLGRYRLHEGQVTHGSATDRATVVSDMEWTLAHVAARYPHLRHATRRGRAELWLWELGARRASSASVLSQGGAIVRSVAADPRRVDVWRAAAWPAVAAFRRRFPRTRR